MRRAMAAGIVAVMVVGMGGDAVAKPTAQVKRLQAQVKTLKGKVREIRRERNQAQRALRGDLAPRVAAVASAGKLGLLYFHVFEPIRAFWPCGASIYQGESLWTLNVNLQSITTEPTVVCSS